MRTITSPMPLTPGEQLILASMKLKPTAEELARMERLVAEVQDWNYCTRLAIDRGIGPLLNHKIPMLGNSHLIPADAQARLQQSYLRTLARSMRLYEAFREVGTALNEAGIKFVALKGVYLAEALYEDIGLRLFSDIDLLVAEEETDKCIEVLIKLGLKFDNPKLYHSKFIYENKDEVHKPPMTKGDVTVEIHRKLHSFSENAAFNINDMIINSETTEINKLITKTLQLNDLIIYICVHLNKHFMSGHIQFTGYSDMINLIELNRAKIDWIKILERSKFHGCRETVVNQLYLIHKLCNVRIPLFLFQGLKRKQTNKNESIFIYYLKGGRFKSENSRLLLKSLNRFNKLSDRIYYIWGIIHPSKEYMIIKYNIKNKKIYLLYYFIRYFHLLTKILSEKKKES